jgi:hypothetical protein
VGRFTSQADKFVVPILTQFFQLSVPDSKDEIYDLSALELAQWVWDIEDNARGRIFSPSGMDDAIVAGGAQPNDLERLACLHPVMQRLMNCAVDDLLPSQEDVNHFNEWREKTLQKPPSRLIWKRNGDSTILFDYQQGPEDVVRLIEIPISEQFTEALYYHHHRSRPPRGTRYPGFGRCCECQSVFLKTRPGQIYCSSRCSHRQGERRRYKVLFELPPETDLTPEIQKSGSEKKGGRPL